MRLIHIYLIATATDLLYCLIVDLFYRATPLFGGHSEEAPPVPFPNTEVKLFSADGTAWETMWESRSLPNSFFLIKNPSALRGRIFFCLFLDDLRGYFPTTADFY